ncbi:MAG: aminopeptidase N C-terminal domain-containing protein [Hyphomicrobiales bacterium]
MLRRAARWSFRNRSPTRSNGVLDDGEAEPAFAAEALTCLRNCTSPSRWPSSTRTRCRRRIARCSASSARRSPSLRETYAAMAAATPGAYSPDAGPAGRRALKSVCLGYLMEARDGPGRQLCRRQFDTAENMTDALAALTLLANIEDGAGDAALAAFYAQWQNEPLVVDKWFAVQARSRRAGALMPQLIGHPAFDRRNPNKIYALLGAFGANQQAFNSADGAGYRLLADEIIAIDDINPLVAARLARAFDRFKRFDSARQAHARAALEGIRGKPGLSKDTAEVVGKALA